MKNWLVKVVAPTNSFECSVIIEAETKDAARIATLKKFAYLELDLRVERVNEMRNP